MKRKAWIVGIWMIAITLIVLVIVNIPFKDVIEIMKRLSVLQVTILVIINAGILLMFGLRWWLILKAQGYAIPYWQIARVRTIAFSISYFTPGPHFGGEPFQAHVLRNAHRVSTENAISSIALDKLIEIISNFTYFLFGISVVLSSEISSITIDQNVTPGIVTILFIPILYLLLAMRGNRPVSALVNLAKKTFPSFDWIKNTADIVASSEDQLGQFINNYPGVMLQMMIVSALLWGALIFEFWLALDFLGAGLAFWEVILVITAARAAILTPLPAALGALESGQLIAMQAIGHDPAIGIALSILIRARDICFGLTGVLWGIGLKKMMGLTLTQEKEVHDSIV